MSDASKLGPLDTIEAAQDAFLKAFADKDPALQASDDEERENEDESSTEGDEGSTEDTEESSEEGSDDESEENEENSEDKSEDGKPKATETASDDVIVKIKVGDKEEDVPVKDLKRLYGQEKALTQKSMEVAETRKKLEEQTTRHVAAAENLVKRAQERYAPFAQIDWNEAVNRLPTDQYRALRDEAQKAYGDLQFYSTELDGYMKQVQETRHNELVNEAKTALKELTDPEKGIKGFDQKVYNEIRSFAVSKGIPQQVVDTIVSAPAIKLIHMAMQFEKGISEVKTTPKTAKAPKTIIKSKKSAVTTKEVSKPKEGKGMQTLRKTGRVDDAAEAFMERFTSRNND